MANRSAAEQDAFDEGRRRAFEMAETVPDAARSIWETIRSRSEPLTVDLGHCLRSIVNLVLQAAALGDTAFDGDAKRVADALCRFLGHVYMVPPEQQQSERRSSALLSAVEAGVDALEAGARDQLPGESPVLPDRQPSPTDLHFAEGFKAGITEAYARGL